MKRKCQINAVYPITCFNVPIVGNTELNLTTEEIYKCLCGKAEVVEILKDGTMISLDFTNYDKVPEIERQESFKDEIDLKPIVEDDKKSVEKVEILNIEKEKIDEDVEEDLSLKEENKSEIDKEVTENPVKTHEVHSRNNNKGKNKKNKR